ncbi:hypothetical protein TREES_T100004040 [Tupaia chinensis]|uniref:Uncharacterized protein n=1 Tax=Tupaia chinensis TaxID=246437 RepID=L9KN03_TUPCH|nr:hypothetical protein TREES_T100004040 [Tupaia chinensis]
MTLSWQRQKRSPPPQVPYVLAYPKQAAVARDGDGVSGFLGHDGVHQESGAKQQHPENKSRARLRSISMPGRVCRGEQLGVLEPAASEQTPRRPAANLELQRAQLSALSRRPDGTRSKSLTEWFHWASSTAQNRSQGCRGAKGAGESPGLSGPQGAVLVLGTEWETVVQPALEGPVK